MNFFNYLSLLFLCTSCVHINTHTLRNINLNDEDQMIVQRAADEWCEKSGGKRCVNISNYNGTHKIENVKAIINCKIPTAIACTSKTENRIITIEFLKSDENSKGIFKNWQEQLYATALHELGHIWLSNHCRAGNMMAIYARQWPKDFHLTDEDLICGD